MQLTDTLVTIGLSLRIALWASLVNLPLALIFAYILSRFNFKGKVFVEGVINLPLVMPPVTTGYLLLFIFGKYGLLGEPLYRFMGLRIAFTPLAAVMASMVVSFPLLYRSIRISMDMVDPKLEDAAQTLGATKVSVFIRITLPMIFPGVINGFVLGFARSLGEFGATMTFAGNIQGLTRTLPLAVYSKLQVPGKEKEAAILVGISIVISFISMFLSYHFTQKGSFSKETV